MNVKQFFKRKNEVTKDFLNELLEKYQNIKFEFVDDKYVIIKAWKPKK